VTGLPQHSSARRFTFRGNLRDTRHGWLRLTPAYSLHLVRELTAQRSRPDLPVLDPFCGTGTTLLVCAEQGVACDTIDVNPFLVWLARAKVARYDQRARTLARDTVKTMARRARSARGSNAWTPPLHRIERWWNAPTLAALARAFAALVELEPPKRARDLALLAFCRALLASSNASFRHQSMSFAAGKEQSPALARGAVAQLLLESIASLENTAETGLGGAPRRALVADSRDVRSALGSRRYGSLITSPPYANRMSYIRELRPYMYWLGYLSDGRSAGQLDWRAIGGTWGSATSNLSSWSPAPGFSSPVRGYASLLKRIETQSPILARYVQRYFVDMAEHLAGVRRVLADGARVHYVVGNSKFFDVLLPVEKILAAQLVQAGFTRPEVRVLRKRTSKPELFEFCVSASV
jgi:hypothetical protein